MNNKGCNHGCIHRREIKVEQMKELYEFRCAVQGRYITKEEIKLRCHQYEGKIKITTHTLEEFFNN